MKSYPHGDDPSLARRPARSRRPQSLSPSAPPSVRSDVALWEHWRRALRRYQPAAYHLAIAPRSLRKES